MNSQQLTTNNRILEFVAGVGCGSRLQAMLAKKHKLPIEEFYKKRPLTLQRSDFFIIKGQKTENNFGRFGIVISAKTAKTAVLRNKIKRIIFDFIRINNFHLEKKGLDIIIYVQKPATGLAKEKLEEIFKEDFINACRKIG